jgi:hypothetical protein
VSGELLLAAGLVLVLAAGAVLAAVLRVRRRVRRAAWVLTRVSAAIGEAERAGRVRSELADTT